MSRVEEMLNELIKKDRADDKKNVIVWVMAIIGVIVAIAAIAYAVYNFMKPKEVEDLEDEFDEEFDDDFFDDEDEEEICDCGECVCEEEPTAEA